MPMDRVWLLLLCRLWVVVDAIRTHEIDQLISTANIYYQRPLRLGEPREQPMASLERLSSPRDVKVIIHGYTGSRTTTSIRPLAQAYLARGADNVFVADWQDAATVDYTSSRKAVAAVAVHLARILGEFISKHQVDRSEVHVIGHSLGAHIAGGVGRFFNGTLGRVTGLDPALPLFAPRSGDGLVASDAQFVDAIHTDFPVFGDITPRATADFYPHFGVRPQRGCNDFDLNSVQRLILEYYSCSHNRAVTLYAESVGRPRNFPALPCSLGGIKSRSVSACLEKLQQDGVRPAAFAAGVASEDESVVVYMGEGVSKSAKGFFYLETFDAPPFGMGANTRF